MSENEIAKLAVHICYNIHKQYGPGLFERVYEELFCYELAKYDIEFLRQHPIKLIHESIKLDAAFKADIILERKVIIELKSVEQIDSVHFKQVLTYLKLTKLKLGLLINFNVPLIKEGIHRIVNNI